MQKKRHGIIIMVFTKMSFTLLRYANWLAIVFLFACPYKVLTLSLEESQAPYYETSKYFWSFDHSNASEARMVGERHVPGVLDTGVRLSHHQDNLNDNISLPWLNLGTVNLSCIITPYHCQDGFTIVFWARMRGNQDNAILLSAAEAENARGVQVRISHHRLRFSTTGLELHEDIVPRTVRRYVDANWDFGTWTHVGLVWQSKAKELKIFYNCSEADYTSAGMVFDRTAHVHNAPQSFIVGASNALRDSAEADIDELGIWDSVLHQEEICQIFDSRRVHGKYSPWAPFTACSKTCGEGTKNRTRTCTNPAPENGGRNCSLAGPDQETVSCLDRECPIDGGFSGWSEFSECSKTCGGGESIRVRTCTKPRPQHGGRECTGSPREIRVCNLDPCPVHGGYSAWSNFTSCTKSCENGTRWRNRSCSDPSPKHGGRNCSHPGPSFQITPCNTFLCPIDGGYTEWSSFTTCTLSCGGGIQVRVRNCTNPRPQHGGKNCHGPSMEILPCNSKPCPIDGYYGAWSEFSACTKDCGNGTKFRTRNCTRPKYGGQNCSEFGEDLEQVSCNTHHCPVHGNYTQWSMFGPCSTTCNNGTKIRTRTCTEPSPKYGGRNCSEYGSPRDEALCNLNECPINGSYGAWRRFSTCSLTCGTAGSQYRTRSCDKPKPRFGGLNCTRLGPSAQTRACNRVPCPIDGAWGPWSSFSDCSRSCESGRRYRTRKCDQPRPQYGGRNCTTISRETRVDTKICNAQLCPDVVIVITISMTTDKWSDSLRLSTSKEYRGLEKKLVDNVKAFYGTSLFLHRVIVLNIRKGSVLADLQLEFFNRGYNGIVGIQEEIFLRNKLGNLAVEILKVTSIDVPSTSPTNITMYNTSSQSIMITWDTVPLPSRNGAITGYTVLHRAVENMTRTSYVKTEVDEDTKSLELRNLEIFEPYLISVYASNRRGSGVPSLPRIVWTEMDVPDASPHIHTTYNVSSTNMFIAWSAIPKDNVRGILLGYLLTYRLVKTDKVFQLKLGSTTNETVLVNLQKYSDYDIHMVAFNRIGSGPQTPTIQVRTDEDVPSQPPQDVQVRNSSSTNLVVSWSPIPKDAIHGILRTYRVYYRSQHSVNWTFITISAQTYDVTITGLRKYHTYLVQVAGVTSKGEGTLSKAKTAMTDQDAPSYYPTGITAVNTSSTSILVEWDTLRQAHVHGVLLGYKVFYKRRALLQNASWTVKTVSPLTRANELVNLMKFTKYNIRIAGFTSKGVGPQSPNRVAITAEDIPSQPVTGVRARATSSTSLYLTWRKIPRPQRHGILRGYKIVYRALNDSSNNDDNHQYSVLKAIPFQHSIAINKLLKFTTYGIRVIGYTIGEAQASEEIFVKTAEDLPSRPPSNIQVKERWTSSTIPVSWQPITPPYYVHGIAWGYRIKYKPIKNTLRTITAPYKIITVSSNHHAVTIKGLKSSTTYSIRLLVFTRIGDGVESEDIIAETCSCQNELTTNWWKLTPYSKHVQGETLGIFPAILQNAITMCCSGCANQAVPAINFQATRGSKGLQKGVVEVNQNINDEIDLHFPIHGSKSQTSYGAGGYPYVALVQSPGAAFIISSKNQYNESERVMGIVFASWPFTIVLVLAAYFVGFIMWMIECRANPEGFPKSCLYGPLNGLWWAYITVTTVGYGDKIPKTFIGRCVAIVWPLVGQIFIVILVAQITTKLSAGIIGTDIRIYGKKIAVIQNSSESRLGIKKNAIFDPDRAYTNLRDIYQDLIDHKVFGALIDTYTVSSEQDLFNNAKLSVNKIYDYSLHYGVVLGGQSRKLQPCLQNFLMRETDQLYKIVMSNVQPLKNVLTRNVRVDKTKSLFDAESPVYQTILIALLALFGSLVVAGISTQVIIIYVRPYWHTPDRETVIAKAREKAFISRQNLLRGIQMKRFMERLQKKLKQTKKKHIKEMKCYVKERKKADKRIQKSLEKEARKKKDNKRKEEQNQESDSDDNLSVDSHLAAGKDAAEMWRDIEPLEGLFSLV